MTTLISATRLTSLLAALTLLTVCTGCATGGASTRSTPGDSATFPKPNTSGPHQTDILLTTGDNFYPDPSKTPAVISSNGQISIIVYGGPTPSPQLKRKPVPRPVGTSGPHQDPPPAQ